MLDLTVLYDADGRASGVEVRYAEPGILISSQILAEIYNGRAGRWLRGVSLTPPVAPSGPSRTLRGYWTGSVLRVEGVNRTVIYRIGEYCPEKDYYEAVWPD